MEGLKIEDLKFPETPDIIGRQDYRATAVLVPLVELRSELHFLFERRAEGIKQPGEVCFPGGHFEKGEDKSFQDTALRETREELGIDGSRVNCLARLDTLVSPRGLIVECYLGQLEMDSLDELFLEKDEVASVFTVPVNWFMKNPPEVYRKRVESRFSPVDENESGQGFLLPVEELGLPAHYKQKKNIWMPRVLVYRHQADIIWGMTAAIVENVVERVFR